MKQNKASIQKSLKALREIIENEKKSNEAKTLAYFAENIIRWTTEDTTDWTRPEDEIVETLNQLRRDIFPAQKGKL